MKVSLLLIEITLIYNFADPEKKECGLFFVKSGHSIYMCSKYDLKVFGDL